MNGFINNYIGFDGRLNRQRFWMAALALVVVNIIVSLLILPLIGLSIMPDMSIMMDSTKTAEEISAFLVAAQSKAGWASLVMFLIFAYPIAAISIKRRHDRNNAGMDVWAYMGLSVIVLLVQALGFGSAMTDIGGMVVPMPSPLMSILTIIVGILGIYLLVVLGFLKGTQGPNGYGPDPLQG